MPRLLAAVLAAVLILGVLPVQAFAVTQAEIDELERRKEAIEAKVEEKQAVADELEAQHAGALEQKQALDERNEYLIQQLQLNDEQIALYDEMRSTRPRRLRMSSSGAIARVCAPWRKTGPETFWPCCCAPTLWVNF